MRFRRVIILAASVLLLAGVAMSQRNSTPEARLRAAMDKETVDGDLKAAMDGYKQVIAQRGASHEVVARALLRLGMAYEKQGDAEARKSYERIVREFADQADVAQQARTRLAASPEVASGKRLYVVCSENCETGDISRDGRLQLVESPLSPLDLSVRTLATGQVQKLIDGAAGLRYFSPDSKQIAYGSPRHIVNVVNVDGSGGRVIYEGADLVAWSPDGTRLLAEAFGGAGQPSNLGKLMWIRVADGSVQALPTTRLNLDVARVSPDGKYVAFNASPDRDGDDKENVYIMAADGSGETLVSPSPIYQEPVGWSPDGKYLLYGQHGSSTTLWAVPVAEGKVRGPAIALRQFDRRVSFLGMMPSGALRYMDTSSGAANLYTASMDPASGRVTSVPVAVPLATTGNGPVAWSPDSSRIAYLTGATPQQRELHVLSLSDGKDQRVAAGFVNSLCWPAGGNSVLTNRNTGTRPNRFEAVRVDLATGEARPIFPGAPGFRLWNCTDTLAANFDPLSIKVRNLQSGAESELYRIKSPTQNYGMSKLSPDGRSIAFMEWLDADTSVLMTVPSSGGAARELARAKAPAQLQQIDGHTWSHDSRFVYFFKRADSRAQHELFRVPVGGGAEERVGGLQGADLRGLEIAPDGTRIAFVIGAFPVRPEIWAMENFLPSAK